SDLSMPLAEQVGRRPIRPFEVVRSHEVPSLGELSVKLLVDHHEGEALGHFREERTAACHRHEEDRVRSPAGALSACGHHPVLTCLKTVGDEHGHLDLAIVSCICYL